MTGTEIDWFLPVIVLSAGLVIGLVVTLLARRGPAAATPSGGPASTDRPDLAASLDWRDLVGQRDALIQQLHELDDTAGKRNAEQLAAERCDLELRAARTLQKLDLLASENEALARKGRRKRRPTPASSHSMAAQPKESSSALRGFLWGVGSIGAVGLLMFLVTRSARPRTEGGSMTGDLPERGGAPVAGDPGVADPQETTLRAALERDPDNFEARIALAQMLLGRSDMMGVWNETQYVLERQPNHAQALSYQALVRVAMGQPELAHQMLERALAAAPDLVDAHTHMAFVELQLGRSDDAQKRMATALRRFPEHAPRLTRLFDEMQQRAAAQPGPGSGSENPHAAPGDAHPTAPPEPKTAGAKPRAEGKRVTGLIELAPNLAGQVPAGAVLFLIVREARLDRGPPAAVQKLEARSFPIRFEMSDADTMAGEPLPSRMRIEVRVDTDGNAMTREADAPRAVADGVKVGTDGLRLVLQR